MKVFIDSGAFIGIYNAYDQYHKTAKQILVTLQKRKIPLFTTDYILEEVYTWFISTPNAGYKTALAFHSDLEQGIAEVHFIGEVIFQRAQEVYFTYNRDKTWSFTDCTSFVIIR